MVLISSVYRAMFAMFAMFSYPLNFHFLTSSRIAQ